MSLSKLKGNLVFKMLFAAHTQTNDNTAIWELHFQMFIYFPTQLQSVPI